MRRIAAGKSFTGKRTFLAQKGLHIKIMDYVTAHPGERLKAMRWAEKFGCSPSTCRKIAASIEKDIRESGKGVPQRESGGLNNPSGYNQTKNVH